MHWHEGLKALNLGFLKACHHPLIGLALFLLTLMIVFRDFILWAFMGDAYLQDEDGYLRSVWESQNKS